MLKKIFLLLIFTPSVFATILLSYGDVVNAIQMGKKINVVLQLSQCTPKLPLSSSYAPNSVMITDDHLAFSDSHFTLKNPDFLNQPVIEYVHYQLAKNSDFTLDTTILDAGSYAPKAQYPKVTCQINQGVKFFSL